MPEWSKGAVSRTAIERCVGSNPTGCIFLEGKRRIKERIKRKERKKKIRGCSSYGRAFASHARGKGIDTPHLHKFFGEEKTKVREGTGKEKE